MCVFVYGFIFKKFLYTILMGRCNHGDIWYICCVIVFLGIL